MVLLVPAKVIAEGCCCRRRHSNHQDVVDMETLIEATVPVVMPIVEQVVVEMMVWMFEEMVVAVDLRRVVLSSKEVPLRRG